MSPPARSCMALSAARTAAALKHHSAVSSEMKVVVSVEALSEEPGSQEESFQEVRDLVLRLEQKRMFLSSWKSRTSTGPKKIGVVVSLRHEGIVARIRVHGKSQPKLFLVAFAGGGSGAVACLIQRRQQHRCQNRNDCNHNQYIYLMVYFWGNTPIVMILEFIDHYCRLGKRGLQDESHYILQTIFWR